MASCCVGPRVGIFYFKAQNIIYSFIHFLCVKTQPENFKKCIFCAEIVFFFLIIIILKKIIKNYKYNFKKCLYLGLIYRLCMENEFHH